jgi:hypothetical protein
MKRLLFGVVLAGVLSAVTLGAAPKSVTSSSIILNGPTGSRADVAWTPHLGDSVSFTANYPSSLAARGISIQLNCFQNGDLVWVSAGYADRSFLLGGTSSPWLELGGPATCRAELYYWSTNGQKYNALASTEFETLGW